MRFLRLWQLAGKDLRLLWFALRHPGRPLWLLPVVALLVFYAVEPLNFALPMVGIVDEFLLLPLVLHWVLKLLPVDIREGFGARAARP